MMVVVLPPASWPSNGGLKCLLHNTHTTRRIDRLASGVLILATSPKKLVQLNKQFAKRSVEKEYIARVKASCSSMLELIL